MGVVGEHKDGPPLRAGKLQEKLKNVEKMLRKSATWEGPFSSVSAKFWIYPSISCRSQGDLEVLEEEIQKFAKKEKKKFGRKSRFLGRFP